MGLAIDLGYSVGGATRLRKAVIVLGATRPVSALSNKVIRNLDRLALRITSGRSTFTSWLTGLHPLWLTTVGARSGQPRTVPLFGIPISGDLALLGTSFAKPETPAWVYNLEANPAALVSYRGIDLAVLARPAEPDEAEAIWRAAAEVYPGYATYAERAAHRVIRVFVLERDWFGSQPG